MAHSERKLIAHFDWLLFSLTLGVAAVGLTSVVSASYAGRHSIFTPLAIRQLLWIAVGTVAMVAAVLVDYRSLQSYAYPFYAAVVALLAVVMAAGHATGGSRRWINLGFFHLEPSELAKLAVVLVLVRYLCEEPPRGGWRLRQLIVPFLLLGIPAALVLKQPDLGTGLVLMLLTVTLIFVSGISWRLAAMLTIAAVLAAPMGMHFLKPYQRQRLVSFLNPQADPLGSGYHIIQSEIAIGAGGEAGKGFLKGTQARLNFLPEQSTDFIFAVYAEEFGLFGAIVLLSLYAAIIGRGAWIARHARDRFGSLLAMGLTAIIFWQVAINLGMATGMLPVVGITLPLVSYGGSSLIAMMAAMGILISINTHRYLF
ncbi:MAG TPA: rod shape-determining protein RodA [Candidatus Binataceae bacterium]|nr:rod shape-determining protein RodA [Candidatus Binataceae bacterium]